MKVKRLVYIFCSIALAALSGCIESPDASQFHAPTISSSASFPTWESVTITCQLSKGAHPSQITFRLSKSQSMSDAIVKTVTGGAGESYSASFSGLEEGTQYYFDAEASGGRSSCRSSVGTFKTSEVFDIDKDTKQINYQQQYVEFEVVSSIGLSVQIEDGANWVRESDTKAATKYRKSFLVDYNSSVEERRATIVFKSDAGGENRTVRIFQAGGPITIPDKNFKTYLVENFDKDGDGEIVLDEAREVKEINVSTNEIKTLKGIEYFENVERIVAEGDGQRGALNELDLRGNTKLKWLYVTNNSLTSIDVSECTQLEILYFWDNNITNLDLSKNENLLDLRCARNDFSKAGLVVSGNKKLQYLYVDNTKLSHIDLSKNVELLEIGVYDNNLSSLDLSHNTKLYHVHASHNQLTQINLSALGSLKTCYCDNNLLKAIDLKNSPLLEQVNFNTNKIESVDVSDNPELTLLELGANNVASLDISNNRKLVEISVGTNPISTLNTENNTLLETLIFDNTNITEFNVSHLKKLKKIWAHSTQITNLDLTENTELEELDISWTDLTSIDLTKNSKLRILRAMVNKPLLVYLNDISSLETLEVNENVNIVGDNSYIEIPDANFKSYLVSNFDRNGDGDISYTEAYKISRIGCDGLNIRSLVGIESMTQLVDINCNGNSLSEINLSANTKLTHLSCADNNLTSLDLQHNKSLVYLHCFDNKLTNLDVTKNTALIVLRCTGNQLTSLDVSKNSALTSLDCQGNQLFNLDVSKNTVLTELNCGNGNGQLTKLDVNTALEKLYCGHNQLTNLDVSKSTALTELYCDNNLLSVLDVSKNTALTTLHCYGNPNLSMVWLASGQNINNLNYDSSVTKIVHKDDKVNIPDANFKNYLVNNFDRNGDGEISYAEGGTITNINVDTRNIASLQGIECFPNLQRLYASGGWDRGLLTEVDVSKNSSLEYLDLWGNKLTSIDVSHNTALTSLNVDVNQMTSLDVSKNTALTELHFSNNKVTSIDVSNNTELSILCCDDDQLTALDVSRNTKLVRLSCSHNQFTTLDVSNNTSLKQLDCWSDNPLMVYLAEGQYIENIYKNENVTLVYGKGNISIPDANFKRYLVQHFDRNGDGEISYEEGRNIINIEVDTKNIASLQGIEWFPNLQRLFASGGWDRGLLTEVDVSKNIRLEYLSLWGNQITSIDVSKNTALKSLGLDVNQLNSLDVRNNKALMELYISRNQIRTIDVTNNAQLADFSCDDDLLEVLDISKNKQLARLTCGGNKLTSLAVHNNTALMILKCDSNQLASLDVSNNTALTSLDCRNANMTVLWLAYGQTINDLNYNREVTTIRYK